MKLHLPKKLRTSVLACVTAMAGVATSTFGTLSVVSGAVAFVFTSQTAYADDWKNDGSSAWYISSGDIDKINAYDGAAGKGVYQIKASTTDLVTNEEVIARDGSNLRFMYNWENGGCNQNRVVDVFYFGEEGTGAGNIYVDTEQVVNIKQLSGTINTLHNGGTLVLGSAESEINFTSTMLNAGPGKNEDINSTTSTGNLTLDGRFNAVDLMNLNPTSTGEIKLSNGTHGFQSGELLFTLVSGGTTTKGEKFSFYVGDENLTDSVLFGSNAVTLTTTTSTTLYEITSAHTEKVTYDGASGDTQNATGFILGNGTTLALTTGDLSKLAQGIKIATGDGGKATVIVANGASQSSSALTSLIGIEHGSYVLGIGGKQDGDSLITTTVTTNNNGGSGFVDGEVHITKGGVLVLHATDVLGWQEGTRVYTDKLVIEGGTVKTNGRQTCSTDIEMKGNAIITAGPNPGSGTDAPILQVHTGMDMTASGTGNKIESSVELRLSQALTINVLADGDLSVQGAITNNSQLTKSGDGKLILDGVAKTLNGQLQMQSGTLQLGGTTAADDLVTLAGGLNQTGGTVDVVGKATIQGITQSTGTSFNVQGDATLRGFNQEGGSLSVSGKAKIENFQKDGGLIVSNLGGAITVASTGELTLNSTFVLTGSFAVDAGGKVIGGNDLKRGANSGRPAEGTNGWDSTILTILQAAEGATVTGLKTAWYNNGEFEVNTSTGEDGVTSYLIDARFNYYVQDTNTKAEYSTATGLTGANTIYMNDGTTLVVKNDLNTSKVSVSEAGKVNYEVDGANLTLAETAHSNIASVTLTQGAKFTMSWNSSIAEKISIGLSDGSLIAMRNGGAGHVLNADISVNGTGYISGSSTGDNSNIQGTIYGKGTLGLLRDQNNDNPWTVSAEIKDGSDGSLSVQVYGGNLDNGSPVTAGNNRVTLSGNNSYSGGTTIYGGTLTAAHTSALGTGAVTIAGGTLNLAAEGTLGAGAITMNGGKLQLSSNSTIASLNVTGGEIITNTKTLTVSGNLTASSSLYMKNGGTVEVLGNLQSSDTLGFYRNNQQTLILHGESNSVAVFDLSDENGSKGTLVLKENTDTTITNQAYTGRGALWMSANSGVELEKNASLSWLGTKVIAKEQGGSISTTANKNVYYAVTEATFENVDLTINSAGGGTTVRSKLTNSSITNNSSSDITVDNGENSLTGVRAIGGNISLQNVGAALSLDVLEMATGKAVNVGFAATVADQGVTVSSTASLLSGSSLNTSLTLLKGATLDMDGTVSIDGALNITGALTMGDKLSAMLAEMSSWETPELVLFTGVSSFNGDAVATEAELASNYFTGASSDLYVEYRVDNNVGSIVIINRMDAVPEPASATLSLAALMMLCARRRRRK